MAHSLPETMKALVCEEVGQPLKLQTLPTPQPTIGSVVVHVLCISSQRSLPAALTGKTFFTFPTPLTPGNAAIGRVAAIGQDTTSLAVGQLVMLEAFIRARDNPDIQILWGFYDGQTPESKKFMADNWSRGTYAEYVRAPLENTWALDEKRLCGSPSDGGLGYTVEDLAALSEILIPYAGLRNIGVQAGEKVIIAPATGGFSGAAVTVAHAMGARVIAMSRDVETLKKMKRQYPAIEIVPNTGDAQADAAALKVLGPIDAYLDISPPQAAASTHIRSCFMAVRQYGRVSLMGMIAADLTMPYILSVGGNLTIRGQFMYEREDVKGLVKLAESGLLKLGEAGGYEVRGRFKLEEIEDCFRVTSASSRAGQIVLIKP
ncbi:putative alcohol dehydrogenase protein [Phaeoacremonium minimum UCRPA7]|uniref:Putative alcohol dehydrogenase protein n=1 Tax=Phaeoacremonium minimum (strain UCR-PA7) TaxID=1286976 RepID=R8BP64_PHAM7|nr:putative alcohol dehydrogenase protein [Phaeoacremonium minimum UCRPA7]EOO01127.1 putative alcohol dehydrogenase protein [Phaeoacremonium minimum UCRPA7]